MATVFSDEGGEIHDDNELRVLVTGANSGLGFGICMRLIDEFLKTCDGPLHLTLILTTRSLAKANDTTNRLQKHISKLQRRSPGADVAKRIHLQPEQLDLCSILSIRELTKKLVGDGIKIDVVVCNAGIGGWTGMNWPLATWCILTDMLHAVTWPTFKISGVGWKLKPQFSARSVEGEASEGKANDTRKTTSKEDQEKELGEVFMANVLGHYMLAHWLVPLLNRSEHGGRILWTSSMEAYAKTLSMDDFQGLKSSLVYEQTKRITDLLVLTSELASTRPWVRSYFSSPSRAVNADPDKEHREGSKNSSLACPYDDADQALVDSRLGIPPTQHPRFYLSHPGVVAPSSVSLPLILEWLAWVGFLLARFLGSPWHTTSAYKGACATVWLALLPKPDLDQLESSLPPDMSISSNSNAPLNFNQRISRKAKWGSAVTRSGKEHVVRTETEGWGWSGQVGEGEEWKSGFKEGNRRGRWKYACNLTKEGREFFEESGRQVWREMEALRVYWESRLEAFEEQEPANQC